MLFAIAPAPVRVLLVSILLMNFLFRPSHGWKPVLRHATCINSISISSSGSSSSSSSALLLFSRRSRGLEFSHKLLSSGSSANFSTEISAPAALPVSASSASSASSAAPPKISDVSMLEIRVGKIVAIAKHPEAESLYVEQVDLGESTGPRTIVSGLVAFCKEEELRDRNVIVLCNLKPRALKGVVSQGMLLCASNADHTQVVPIVPPPESPIGQLITFDGHPSAIVEPGNKATKAFTKVADDFFVDDNNIATYKTIPFATPQGLVSSTLKGKIS